MKVLLADDDADQLELRSLTLVRAGYDISIASDVQTALRTAAQDVPDVAVVDLNMPTEEAGLRLIRGLKKLDLGMRVIVLTGSDPRKLEKHSERSLVEAIFTKGNASRQLVQHLKESQGFELRRRLAVEGQLVLDIKVSPRSSRTEIAEFAKDGSLKVKLAAVPEKGRANDELVEVLAGYFGVPARKVELMSGENSQRKRVRIVL